MNCGFLLATTVAGLDMNRFHPEETARLDVGILVSDDIGALRIDAPLVNGALKQARPRFPTVTLAFGTRLLVHPGDRDCGRKHRHALPSVANHAASHREVGASQPLCNRGGNSRVVGNDKNEISTSVEPPDCLHGSRHPFQVFDARQIIDLLIQNPVPIEEYRRSYWNSRQ